MRVFEDKTILVTGATGLIGSHVIRRLLQCRGCEVTALDLDIRVMEKVFRNCEGAERLTLMEGSIADGMPQLGRSIDYIFHAGSPTSLDDLHNIPVEVIRANVMGTMNCLEYLRGEKERNGHEGRMVMFSSVRLYGSNPDGDRRVTEDETEHTDALYAPNIAYSESKRMIETCARAYYRQYGIETFIARFGTVYGYELFAPDTAFFEFVFKALRGEDITLNHSGAARRDNIYAEDAVDALMCIVEKGEPCVPYNVSSGGDKGGFAAVDEIAQAIATAGNKLLGHNIKVVVKEEPRERAAGLILDNGRLKGLGWNVSHSLTEGIEKTLMLYKENK